MRKVTAQIKVFPILASDIDAGGTTTAEIINQRIGGNDEKKRGQNHILHNFGLELANE